MGLLYLVAKNKRASIGPGGIEMLLGLPAFELGGQLQSDQVELKSVGGLIGGLIDKASIGPGGIEIFEAHAAAAVALQASIGPGGIEIDSAPEPDAGKQRLQSDQVELKWLYTPDLLRYFAASIGPGGIEIG